MKYQIENYFERFIYLYCAKISPVRTMTGHLNAVKNIMVGVVTD